MVRVVFCKPIHAARVRIGPSCINQDTCTGPGKSKIALVRLIGTCIPECVCYSMLPPEYSLMLWDGFWGPTTSLCFSPVMVTEVWFASHLHTWRVVSISIDGSRFQAHPGNHEWKSSAHKSVKVLLYGSYSKQHQPKMCGYRTQNLLLLRSWLLTQFTSWQWMHVGTDLCRRYTSISSAREGLATQSQWKHWSGGCKACQTCPTSPVLSPGLAAALSADTEPTCKCLFFTVCSMM